jgi:hypothetical protein
MARSSTLPRMLRSPFLLAVVATALLVAPAPASAQGTASDPGAETPSGHVYELPLDSARGDAAPKRSYAGDADSSDSAGARDSGTSGSGRPAGGSGATSGDGPREDSPAGQDGADPAAGGSSDEEDEEHPTSAIRSENGFGSSSQVPGVDKPPAARDAAPTVSAATVSDPSGLRVYGLLALGVLLACGVGFASRTVRRDA